MKKLLTTAIMLGSLNAHACDEIKTAYSNLLASNFIFKKALSVEVDQARKLELTSYVAFVDGVFSRENEEVLFKVDDYRYEEDDDEAFVLPSFECKDVEVDGQTITIKQLVDDKTRINTFRYSAERSLLYPLKTQVEGEVGLLFVNWHVKAVTQYREFKIL